MTRTGGQHQKKRIFVACLHAIKRFNEPYAYSLPNISQKTRNIPNTEEEKKVTAFGANLQLCQFHRVPFGVTNGGSCFKRTIDNRFHDEVLKNAFAFVDKIAVSGKKQAEHDANVVNFLRGRREE